MPSTSEEHQPLITGDLSRDMKGKNETSEEKLGPWTTKGAAFVWPQTTRICGFQQAKMMHSQFGSLPNFAYTLVEY